MRSLVLTTVLFVLGGSPAWADYNDTDGSANTTRDGVRVTITKAGGEYRVEERDGGGGAPKAPDCQRVQVFTLPPDPATGAPGGRYALVTCDELLTGSYWVEDGDVVDLDAAAAAEAGRYVEDVLKPGVRIGVNPAAKGLVGLPSWFWIEGWSGSAQAPPISAYGVSIDVRMASTEVHWDFGDGASLQGDLGRPYPTESTVRHAYQGPDDFTVTATIELSPEYRVDGGPWLPLPPLSAAASTQHPVQERQAVLIER